VRPAAPELGPLLEFMLQLGQAYLACGEQTAEVEEYLRRVARARGLRRTRVVAFPTAVFITVNDGTAEHVTLSEGASQRLRLDQIAEIYALGGEAQRGNVSPRDGLARLDAISQMKPRSGSPGVVLGHAVLTVGLAVILLPSILNVAVAAALGLIVALLKTFYRDQPILAAPLSVVAAALVSVLVFLAVWYGLDIDPVYSLVPPLVTFLPGAMLAFSLVELTSGDMVSGASRLLTGLVQLVLLAFGLTAGALLVGYQPHNLLDGHREVVAPLWTAVAGVVVFGVGVYFHHSAPPRSLGWMLLVLFAAFGGQRLTADAVGPEMSGFFGMLSATVLGNLIEKRLGGPPAMVTFLPSFWLLVPGVLGLISVKQLLTNATSLDNLVRLVFTFTSIALGTLVGESLYKGLGKRIDGWLMDVRRSAALLRRKDRS
jgi:uncharacterized membrane protein YjjP (DUF1212 family)